MRQIILPQLCILPHIPHATPFPFIQLRIPLRYKGSEDCSHSHSFYCSFLSSVENFLSFHYPHPHWSFSDTYYLREKLLLLIEGASLNFTL